MHLQKIISLIHRKMNTELNIRLKKIGLSCAMSRLLLHLYHNGKMTQADLCRELELDKSTVAKILTRMEHKGLIKKQINPNDVRSYIVSLTPKAYGLIPRIQEILLSWSEDVTAGMSKVEKDILYELLRKVARQAVSICNK